jgi:hypothetical protein
VSAGRYAGAKPAVYVSPAGVRVAYLPPRMLPQAPSAAAPPPARTTVRDDERHRLDLVAHRTLRDPLLAWRLSDANVAMDPFALVDRTGTILAVPGLGL